MILLFAGELDAAETGFEAVLAIEHKATSVTIRVRALTFLCILERKRLNHEQVFDPVSDLLVRKPSHSA